MAQAMSTTPLGDIQSTLSEARDNLQGIKAAFEQSHQDFATEKHRREVAEDKVQELRDELTETFNSNFTAMDLGHRTLEIQREMTAEAHGEVAEVRKMLDEERSRNVGLRARVKHWEEAHDRQLARADEATVRTRMQRSDIELMEVENRRAWSSTNAAHEQRDRANQELQRTKAEAQQKSDDLKSTLEKVMSTCQAQSYKYEEEIRRLRRQVRTAAQQAEMRFHDLHYQHAAELATTRPQSHTQGWLTGVEFARQQIQLDTQQDLQGQQVNYEFHVLALQVQYEGYIEALQGSHQQTISALRGRHDAYAAAARGELVNAQRNDSFHYELWMKEREKTGRLQTELNRHNGDVDRAVDAIPGEAEIVDTPQVPVAGQPSEHTASADEHSKQRTGHGDEVSQVESLSLQDPSRAFQAYVEEEDDFELVEHPEV